ncbi:MAG: glycosyltransferase family 2 protein [Caldilineales bacterium]|nr:glycosyltransferase family 2 protein [Caldilineales bacterium]MDW8317987.1 glycosyltransferase family 2 protein [Anaerolineae bacterium]
MPSVDFTVVVVSWNTRDLLRQCLRSVCDEPAAVVVPPEAEPPEAPAGLTVEIIVVDNASSDGSAAMVQAEFPQVRLVANPVNAGFAAANNQAIRLARGEVLFLLNPDAYLLPGALQGLKRFLDAHPEAAVAGPNVLNPNGTWQAAAFRFPTLWDLFCEAVFLSVLWPRSPLFARRELGGFQRDAVREVDWVQGCAMAIRRSAWDAVGPFDEGYWMYVEELDWCRRAKGMGYRVFFTPDAQVVHLGKRAVARARAAVLPLGFRSHFRYFRKFDGRSTELAVRLITLLQMGLRALISAGMIAVTRGSERRRWQENWRAYTGVMREALRFRTPGAQATTHLLEGSTPQP